MTNLKLILEKKQVYCKTKYVGGCRNAVRDGLTIFTKAESSFEECFELCYYESECERFYYGTIGTGNHGKCTLKRPGCQSDTNPSWENYFVKDCKYGSGTFI